MADNVAITAGTGTNIAADEVVDGTLGTVKVQYIKMMDGTLDSSNKLIINSSGAAFSVIQPSAAAGGHTATRVNAAATTNATSLKASAGNIVAIDLFNVASYSVFLKLYNKASAPTVGTDTPIMTVPLPAGTGYSRDFTHGKVFSTGIAFALTKLQADSDTTALVAGDVTGAIAWI